MSHLLDTSDAMSKLCIAGARRLSSSPFPQRRLAGVIPEKTRMFVQHQLDVDDGCKFSRLTAVLPSITLFLSTSRASRRTLTS